MRIESSVTSITWIPSEAISGMPKLPFELGVAHYDDPPPERIEDLDALHKADAFREANELRAWIEVDDGRVVDHGYSGRGLIGVTRLKLGSKEMSFPAVQYPLIQAEAEVGPDWVRFQQTAGGHMGLPAPRRVRGKPFFRVSSSSAWTTLQLIVYADGSSKHSLVGASTFPRHWVYDRDGRLTEKSGVIDFKKWWLEAHGEGTPWGEEDSPALATAVESELERELSASIMSSGQKLDRRKLKPGDVLVEQGAEGDELFLLLDGVVEVSIDGAPVAEVGPGTVLGERAALEGGRRTATLTAVTACRVAVVPAEQIDESAREELAATRRST